MATIVDFFVNDGKSGSANPCRRSAQKWSCKQIVSKLSEFDQMKASEFSITFISALNTRYDEQGLKDILKRELKDALKHAPKTVKILLIGEHGPKGLLFHYHGMIQGMGNDKLCALRRRLRRKIGRTEIKQISFWESYKVYMFKSHSSLAEFPEEWKRYSYIKIGL